jgi:16S rRNA (adenine1518-N6/adenine1519-N6)-dimethyltransferase
MEAKRSLGQNFFVNKNLGEYTINLLPTNVNTVIEIGPGMGFFTEKLLHSFPRVIAIEKDTQLSSSLQSKYSNLDIYNEDFLDINLGNIVKEDTIFFGSLPFNVSKPIIRKIIESKYFTKQSFFIVQKEVAEKYLYKEPYSILSLSTKIYADCKKVIDISPESFRPKPNVYSSLISFTPNNKNVENTKDIEDLIKLCFKQPRKNVNNNLKGTRFKKIEDRYKTVRPQQLSLDDFIQIYKYSL